MLRRNKLLMAGSSRPAMLTLGSGPGTITPNTAGYALSGFADTAFAYLAAPKTAGKWYWEVTLAGSYALPGIADDVSTAVNYGGYSSTNAGIYTTSSMGMWVDSGWTGGSTGGGWTLAAAGSGDVLGFALDIDSATKTLKIYRNNVLGGTISWTSGPSTIWPMFAFQFGPSCQVNLGVAGCVYSPPGGYSYI